MRSSVLATVLVLAGAGVLPAQRPVRDAAPLAQRPPAPAKVTATITGPGTVQLTWDAVPDATAYEIGRIVAPYGWQRVTRVDGNTTSYVDANRDLSKPHQYQVVTIVGNMASLPRRSALTSPVANRPDTATPPSSTPTTAPATIKETPGKCWPDESNADRMHCEGAGKQWTAQHRGDEFVSVQCPDGYVVISGGHNTLLFRSAELRQSFPRGNGWTIWVQVRGGETGFATAHALCERKR